MDKQKILSFTKAVAPYLICFVMCVVMAQAQDSITNMSHNSRSFTQSIAGYTGKIMLCVGLIAAGMRRSARILIASLVVGVSLIVSGDIYNALTGSL
jgi:glutamine cyclotransferase